MRIQKQKQASGSADCTIGIWALHDVSAPMRRFVGHTAMVTSVAFSPDGTQVVSSSTDETVRVWALFSRTIVSKSLQHAKPVMLAQFASDGTHIISFSHGVSRDRGYPLSRELSLNNTLIWGTSDWDLRGFHNYRNVELMTISSQDVRVAGVVDDSISAWDMHSDSLIAGPFNGHTQRLTSIKFSADSTRIISTSEDRTVRIWNVIGSKVIQDQETAETQYTSQPRLEAIAPNQASIATRGQGMIDVDIYIFNLHLHTTTRITSPRIVSPTILVQFSLDTNRIWTVHRHGMLCTWDARTGELIDEPCQCSSGYRIESAACLVDGLSVATSYRNQNGQDIIEIWDTQAIRSVTFCVPTWTGTMHDSPIFSSTGKVLLTRFLDPTNRWDIWDTDTGSHVAGPVRCEAEKWTEPDLSPDGKYILCCPASILHRNGPQLFNTKTGEVTFMPSWGQLNVHYARDPAMAKFSFDGLYAVCYLRERCYIWNIGDQTVVLVLTDLSVIPQHVSYAGGSCVVSGISESGILQARQFRIDKPLFTLRSDGWLVDDLSQPMFWVPAEIRDEFPRSDGIDINKSGVSLFASYSDILVGDVWSKCYIGD